MWFSKNNHSSITFIKIKGLKKEEKEHYFEAGIWEDAQRIEGNTFTGRLVKISPDQYEFEGNMRNTIKFLFVDNNHEHFQLDISYNSLSRSLLNSLLGFIDTRKENWITQWCIEVELSLYINKENYKQMGVKVNGERAKWRWDIEAQKAMIETITKKNGTKENDYFEYDEKLKSCIPEIQAYIEVTDFAKEEVKEEKQSDPISIDDVPF